MCRNMEKNELADFRARLGLTQAEFGDWLGVQVGRTAYSANVISRYESGRADVPWAIAAVIWRYELNHLKGKAQDE